MPPISPPPGRGGQGILVPERPVLARDRVRFVGEEIAVVVAETAAAARDAADLIEVEYEDLPVLIGFENAHGRGRRSPFTTIFPAMSASTSNMATRQKTAEAFARAAWHRDA